MTIPTSSRHGTSRAADCVRSRTHSPRREGTWSFAPSSRTSRCRCTGGSSFGIDSARSAQRMQRISSASSAISALRSSTTAFVADWRQRAPIIRSPWNGPNLTNQVHCPTFYPLPSDKCIDAPCPSDSVPRPSACELPEPGRSAAPTPSTTASSAACQYAADGCDRVHAACSC